MTFKSYRLRVSLLGLLLVGCSLMVGLYSRLHSHLYRLLAASTSDDSRDHNAPTNILDKDIPCQWIVLVGDSNIRGSYYEWADLETKYQHSTVRQAEWKPKQNARRRLLECDESTWRWVDKEMVLLSNKSKTCRIVTLKFLTGQSQQEVGRLDHLLEHSSHYCPGYELENVLPRGYSRPAKPDTLWLSHGLWGLPNQGNFSSTEEARGTVDCQERFAPHVQILKGLVQGIRSLTWQTLFPINQHPSITNAYLEWDYQCQLETAKQEGISNVVYDLYQVVAPKRETMFPKGNYHFIDKTILVRQFLDKCCGGWDYYWKHP